MSENAIPSFQGKAKTFTFTESYRAPSGELMFGVVERPVFYFEINIKKSPTPINAPGQ